jgi:hypothetical protein
MEFPKYKEYLKIKYQSPKYKKSSKEITKKLSEGKGQVYEWNEAEGTFKKSTLNLGTGEVLTDGKNS